MTFTSTRVEAKGDEEFTVHGDPMIRDVTRPVDLDVEFTGLMEKDAFGKRRAAFTATTDINHKDFGISWTGTIEAGDVVVGDKVKVTLNIALVQDGIA